MKDTCIRKVYPKMNSLFELLQTIESAYAMRSKIWENFSLFDKSAKVGTVIL